MTTGELQITLAERQAAHGEALRALSDAEAADAGARAALLSDPSTSNVTAAERAQKAVARCRLMASTHAERLKDAQRELATAERAQNQADLLEHERQASEQFFAEALGPEVDALVALDRELAQIVGRIQTKLQAQHRSADAAAALAPKLGLGVAAHRIPIEFPQACARLAIRDQNRARSEQVLPREWGSPEPRPSATPSAADWLQPALARLSYGDQSVMATQIRKVESLRQRKAS